jgi:hypothetical protein
MRQWYRGWWWIFGGYFYWHGGMVFLQGFREKRGAERGFSMVKLWWVAGESWCVDGRVLGDKNFPLFSIYFLSCSGGFFFCGLDRLEGG